MTVSLRAYCADFFGGAGSAMSHWVVLLSLNFSPLPFMSCRAPAPCSHSGYSHSAAVKNYSVQCVASVSMLLPPSRRQRNPS